MAPMAMSPIPPDHEIETAESDPIAVETEHALRRVSTATLTTQLLKRGVRSTFLTGVKPIRPDLRLVGRAFTLRYVPMRDDMGGGPDFDNDTNVQRIAVESIGAGDVLVIEARQDVRAASLGHILATRVMRRGAAGIVTDGAFRDTPDFARLGLATYAASVHAAVSSEIHLPIAINVPIGCAGILVMPGDVMVGDGEGVVVVPAALADEVAASALEQENQESFILRCIEQGAALHGVYPPDEALLNTYRDQRSSSSDSV